VALLVLDRQFRI